MRKLHSRSFAWPVVTVLLAALLALLAAGACVGETEEREDSFAVDSELTEQRDGSFAVEDAPRLVVDNDNGSVTVVAGVAGDISVRATLRRPSRIDYEVVQEGNTVTVTADVHDGVALLDWSRSPGATLTITVPPDTLVDISTSNGGVDVTGIRQSARLNASNGTIEVKDFEGDLVAETSNGAIELTDYTGSAEMDTSNGRIDLKSVFGTFNARASNGRILFAGEFAPGGTNAFNTSNGGVTVAITGEPSVDIDARTSNGSVSTDFPILTQWTGSGDRLQGTIGDGDATLIIRTSNGRIEIEDPQ
jgi:hypothetical protein